MMLSTDRRSIIKIMFSSWNRRQPKTSYSSSYAVLLFLHLFVYPTPAENTTITHAPLLVNRPGIDGSRVSWSGPDHPSPGSYMLAQGENEGSGTDKSQHVGGIYRRARLLAHRAVRLHASASAPATASSSSSSASSSSSSSSSSGSGSGSGSSSSSSSSSSSASSGASTTPPPVTQPDIIGGKNTSSLTPVAPVAPTGQRKGEGKVLSFTVSFTVIFVVLLCIAGCVVYYRFRRRRPWRNDDIFGASGGREEVPENASQFFHQYHIHEKEPMGLRLCDRNGGKEGVDVQFFNYETIKVATNNFSDKLGKGGFGSVYKGKLPCGRDIAVKKPSNFSKYGPQQLKNEYDLTAKLGHCNVVRLLGYCEGVEMILVYEYMPNKSLDAFIFDRLLRSKLEWDKRFNIVLGIAQGLLYLHEDSGIIHGDLNTSNVLLDEKMKPKISDLGLAKRIGSKETEGLTGVVVGTRGYISPDHALNHPPSVKCDVFSFGIVLLEVISGKRSTDYCNPSIVEPHLLRQASELWKTNKALELMDSSLEKSCKKDEVLRCIQVGLLCVQRDRNERPTMSRVIGMLRGEAMPLLTPSQLNFTFLSGQPTTAASPSSQMVTCTHSESKVSIEEAPQEEHSLLSNG